LQQFEQAFQYLNDALRLDDQLHEAYWMKGKIYATTGADEKALSSYQTAIEVNPDFYEGFITLGIFLAERSDAWPKSTTGQRWSSSLLQWSPFTI
jgi:tetratricopeptide (TPR) repeat protein